jgi:hypothetical protein
MGRASLVRAWMLAGVVLGLALPGSATAAGSYASITNVTYEATQPSAPDSCRVPPGLSGSGSESYDTPDGARNSNWDWTIPATLTAGAGAHIMVTSQSHNNGGSSDAIAIGAPQEFGTTPSSPNQVIASVPVGAPGSASAAQSYTFHPTRDFVTGEKLFLRIGFGCANFVYEYTGHAASPAACSASAVGRAAPAARTCTRPKKLPLTPSTRLPRAGQTTSYAAPQDFTHPVTIPVVAIRPNDASATLDIGMSRDSGKLLNDTDFLATISDENIGKAINVCGIFLAREDGSLIPEEDAILSDYLGQLQAARCVTVVAQILQRAEKLHAKPAAATAATTPCRFGFARFKRARHTPRVRLTCARTRAGFRITIRPAVRGRTLRSLIGSSPRLVIGRLRSTDPVQARDRVNVRWRTATR